MIPRVPWRRQIRRCLGCYRTIYLTQWACAGTRCDEHAFVSYPWRTFRVMSTTPTTATAGTQHPTVQDTRAAVI